MRQTTSAPSRNSKNETTIEDLIFVNAEAKRKYFASLSENNEYLRKTAEQFAGLSFEKEISKEDWMPNENSEQYYQTGLATLSAINRCLAVKHVKLDDSSVILDFGAGHGRVTRMLRAQWPGARIDVTDIVKGAVDFCEQKLGSVSIYGNRAIGTACLILA